MGTQSKFSGGSGQRGSGGSNTGGDSVSNGGNWSDGLFTRDPDQIKQFEKEVANTLNKVLQKNKQYVKMYLESNLLKEVYKTLFEFKDVLDTATNDKEKAQVILNHFGIGDQPGFLFALSTHVVKQIEQRTGLEKNEKVKDVATKCIQDFLLQALDNPSNPKSALELYTGSNAQEALAALNPATFQSTSGYFMKAFFTHLIRREVPHLSDSIRTGAIQQAEVLGNSLIAQFEQKKDFHLHGRPAYRDFFRLMGENQNWFFRTMKKVS